MSSSRFLIHSIIMLGNVGTYLLIVPALLCKPNLSKYSTRVPWLPADDELSLSELEKHVSLHEVHSCYDVPV